MEKRLFAHCLGLVLALLSSPLISHAKPDDLMAYRMDYEIRIGDKPLKALDAVLIETNAEALSDTAVITLPAQYLGRAVDVERYIKRGDAVSIRLGYDGQLQTEFTGYLRAIKPNAPMRLECEDETYLLRRPVPDKVFKKTTALDVLGWVVAEVNKGLAAGQKFSLVSDVKGFQFDKFTTHKATAYQVLERLKQDFPIYLYARGTELHAHLAFTEKRGEVVYDFGKNVEQSDGLQYVSENDVRVLVKVIGKTRGGAAIEKTAGEAGGDVRTVRLSYVSDEATLQKTADKTLQSLRYNGYRGHLVAWGRPFLEYGYSARIVDGEYPQREGTYYVTSVKSEFSKSTGFRRTVGLGVKLG